MGRHDRLDRRALAGRVAPGARRHPVPVEDLDPVVLVEANAIVFPMGDQAEQALGTVTILVNNAFRPRYIETLEALTAVIDRLTIPVRAKPSASSASTMAASRS